MSASSADLPLLRPRGSDWLNTTSAEVISIRGTSPQHTAAVEHSSVLTGKTALASSYRQLLRTAGYRQFQTRTLQRQIRALDLLGDAAESATAGEAYDLWDRRFRNADWLRQSELAVALISLQLSESCQPWIPELLSSLHKLMTLDPRLEAAGISRVVRQDAFYALNVISQVIDQIDKKPFIYPTPSGGLTIEIDASAGNVTILVEKKMVMVASSIAGQIDTRVSLTESDAQLNETVSCVRGKLSELR